MKYYLIDRRGEIYRIDLDKINAAIEVWEQHLTNAIQGAIAVFEKFYEAIGHVDPYQRDYERSRADLAAKRKELRRNRKRKQWG